MGWAQQLLSSLRHPSFLFRHRHNTPFSSSPTVCQCPTPDHTAHCLPFKDLRAINTRWWQLTPHNHQGRDNNFFVQNHLCSELLSRCQWLSSSFHALRCGLYVAPALALSDCICHFMPSSSTLPAQGLPNQLKIQKYKIHNTILKTVPLLYLAVFVISCILCISRILLMIDWSAVWGSSCPPFVAWSVFEIQFTVCAVWEWMLHGVRGGESLPWARTTLAPIQGTLYSIGYRLIPIHLYCHTRIPIYGAHYISYIPLYLYIQGTLYCLPLCTYKYMPRNTVHPYMYRHVYLWHTIHLHPKLYKAQYIVYPYTYMYKYKYCTISNPSIFTGPTIPCSVFASGAFLWQMLPQNF